ncbi:unnamed protein product [Linum trigynum]|uniref:Uncharacterized protein n=1 Tax=Linum trigynum TaxID=586398 RepID=A0AAV2CKI7_9ROSI
MKPLLRLTVRDGGDLIHSISRSPIPLLFSVNAVKSPKFNKFKSLLQREGNGLGNFDLHVDGKRRREFLAAVMELLAMATWRREFLAAIMFIVLSDSPLGRG